MFIEIQYDMESAGLVHGIEFWNMKLKSMSVMCVVFICDATYGWIVNKDDITFDLSDIAVFIL